MSNEPARVTCDEGVESSLVEELTTALSRVRTFLAKAEELDLELSSINFVRLMMYDFAPSEDDLKKEDLDFAAQPRPLLAPFDRDLVGLHLPLDGQHDELHLCDVVWTTTASMERFRRLLDLSWHFNCEYGHGNHRALDQRH